MTRPIEILGGSRNERAQQMSISTNATMPVRKQSGLGEGRFFFPDFVCDLARDEQRRADAARAAWLARIRNAGHSVNRL